jgi:hypothetical protein
MEMIRPNEAYTVVRKLQFLEARERFLPVKRAALRDRMLSDPRLSADEREQLATLFEMVAARFHFEFNKKLDRLKALYNPFDPDCDTLPFPGRSTDDQEAQREEIARAFCQILMDANYTEMPREQIIACAEYPSQTRLVVKADLSRYSQLRVFYRGIRRESRTVRLWLTPWKQTTTTVHVFARVAVLVRLAKRAAAPKKAAAPTPRPNPNDDPVFLKLFKNVVVEDLEMLLPYVRIRMRMLDHLKIGSSVAGSVATASWKAFTATVLSPWLLALVMIGFIGAGIRGLFGFLSSKTKYMQTLSSNLYFQNLANNASALAHLADSAESQEFKEMLLAYYILYAERDRDYTQEQLGHRVEQWLQTEFGVEVNLEVADAVRKLAEKDVLVRRPGDSASPDDILKVYDLPSTFRRLDAVWDAYFLSKCMQLTGTDRLADADWPAYPNTKTDFVDEAATARRLDVEETTSPHSAVVPQSSN